MQSIPPHSTASSPYVIILSGTHVTGKETIAINLSQSLNTPWLKGEPVSNSANLAARSNAKHAHSDSSYAAVYGRTWLMRMRMMGLELPTSVPQSPNHGTISGDKNGKCLALVTNYHLRKPARDGVRESLLAEGVRAIFVILQITPGVLSGRTLGAEEPELAERIMKEKVEDLREPSEEETDVLVVDSMQDVDTLTVRIEEIIRQQVGVV